MRNFYYRTLLAAFLLLCSTIATAHDFEVDGIYYNILSNSDKTAEVTYKGAYISIYDEYTGNVIIPENVNYNGVTYNVTKIGDGAFYNSSNLRSITIPSCITTIGNGETSHATFGDCYALKEVHIADISSWCKIDFGSGNSNPLWTGSILYLNGEKVTDIVIPDDITELKKYTFYKYHNLKNLTITANVTSINTWSLANCNNIESIIVDNNNTVYDSREECNAIIETATNKLIIGCKNTKIPNNITSIESYAFYNCTGLTNINIPDGITTIKAYTFHGCTGLTSINIPNSLISIENNTFNGCTGLTKINIPKNLTSIGSNAFMGCYNIKKVYITNLSSWCKIDFTDLSSNPLCNEGYLYITEEEVNSLCIPDDITEIRQYTFAGCASVTNVTIGNSITKIGDEAFINCTRLENIEISNNVTSIDKLTFLGCNAIKSICVKEGNPIYDSRENCHAIIETSTNKLILGCKNTQIPNSVTSIEDYAFNSCPERIIFPSNLSKISSNAFGYCNNIKEVISYISAENLFAINSTQFMSGIQMKYPTLYVPYEALTKYKTTNGWKNFTNIKGFFPPQSGMCGDSIEWNLEYNTLTISGFGKIYDYNSSNNKAPWYDYRDVIENVIIENGITEIGAYTFYNNNKLANISIANSVTKIGAYAFGYSDLTKIDIPASVTEIEDYAFISCHKVIYVNIPSNVKYIANNAFNQCDNIENITVNYNDTYDSREGCNAIIETATNKLITGCKNSIIPGSVTSIGASAFEGCAKLTEIEIPNSVTEIENRAFYNCRSILNIIIPNSVKNIGTYAFYNCSAMTDITIPKSVIKIDDYAFYNCNGLTTITISNKDTNIGSYVFSNCKAIKEIYSKSNNPAKIHYSTFDNYNATLYIPTGSKDNYLSSYYWKNFTNIVEREFYAPGDINCDDRVDVADITTIVNLILKNDTTNYYFGDLNGDGLINIGDITILVDLILNQ